MSTEKPFKSPDKQILELLRLYGPLVGGINLCRFLGFPSQDALARAVRLGTVGVVTFSLPGRKGRFARTEEIAKYLHRQEEAARQVAAANAPPEGGDE